MFLFIFRSVPISIGQQSTHLSLVPPLPSIEHCTSFMLLHTQSGDHQMSAFLSLSDTAVGDLQEALTQHKTQHQDTALIVAGDFNCANLKRAMANFFQQITCLTRGEEDISRLLHTVQGQLQVTIMSIIWKIGPCRHLPHVCLQTKTNKGSSGSARGESLDGPIIGRSPGHFR